MNDIETLKGKHIYTSEQKIKWFGYGEWVEEVDELVFLYKEFECTVVRKVEK